MASPGPSLFKRFLSLFRPPNARKVQGKAKEGHSQPNANGRIYGESVLSNVYETWIKHTRLRKTFFEHQMNATWTSTKSTFVPEDCDEPAEVFLDENGQIQEPLERKIAFDFCNLDRWCMPDCVPGIVSRVDITRHDGFPSKPVKIITVLYANDKYIHLAPQQIFYIEPEDDYYKTVEAHFFNRGIDYIRETKVNSADWDNWAKQFGNKNGFRNQKTSTTNNRTARGRAKNPQVVSGRGIDPDFFYITTTITTRTESEEAQQRP
ncbi:MAG: hypothetical protein ACR2PH_16460 [Desulfobulbia bacterium]